LGDNQQDQDAGNVAAMISLIVDGKGITFREKGAVLAADKHDSLAIRSRPFLDQMT
jgi:hypothetical protein